MSVAQCTAAGMEQTCKPCPSSAAAAVVAAKAGYSWAGSARPSSLVASSTEHRTALAETASEWVPVERPRTRLTVVRRRFEFELMVDMVGMVGMVDMVDMDFVVAVIVEPSAVALEPLVVESLVCVAFFKVILNQFHKVTLILILLKI